MAFLRRRQEQEFQQPPAAQPPAAMPPPPPAFLEQPAAPGLTPPPPVEEAPAEPISQFQPVEGYEDMLDMPLGTLIFRAGLIAPQQLEDALAEGLRTGKRLGEVLLSRGWLTELDLGRLLAGQKGLPFLDISTVAIDPNVARRVTIEDSRRLMALPLLEEFGVPIVALADPNEDTMETVRRLLGTHARFVVSPPSILAQRIEMAAGVAPGAGATPVEAPVAPPDPTMWEQPVAPAPPAEQVYEQPAPPEAPAEQYEQPTPAWAQQPEPQAYEQPVPPAWEAPPAPEQPVYEQPAAYEEPPVEQPPAVDPTGPPAWTDATPYEPPVEPVYEQPAPAETPAPAYEPPVPQDVAPTYEQPPQAPAYDDEPPPLPSSEEGAPLPSYEPPAPPEEPAPPPVYEEPLVTDVAPVYEEPFAADVAPAFDEPVAAEPPPAYEEPFAADPAPAYEEPAVVPAFEEPLAAGVAPAYEEPVPVAEQPVVEEPVAEELVTAPEPPAYEEPPAAFAEPPVEQPAAPEPESAPESAPAATVEPDLESAADRNGSAPPPPPPSTRGPLGDGLRPIGETPHIDYPLSAFDLDAIGRTPQPPEPAAPALQHASATPQAGAPEPPAEDERDQEQGGPFELTLRLADGERMFLGKFPTEDDAQAGARAFAEQLKDNDWPNVNGRMIRRDAIVSIDIEHNDTPGWGGSGDRGRRFDR